MIEVSDFLIILLEIASSREKIFEISSSIVDNSSNARPRTLMTKERKYNCTLKKNAALIEDHQFRSKLSSFKERINSHQDPKENKKEMSATIKVLDTVLQS